MALSCPSLQWVGICRQRHVQAVRHITALQTDEAGAAQVREELLGRIYPNQPEHAQRKSEAGQTVSASLRGRGEELGGGYDAIALCEEIQETKENISQGEGERGGRKGSRTATCAGGTRRSSNDDGCRGGCYGPTRLAGRLRQALQGVVQAVCNLLDVSFQPKSTCSRSCRLRRGFRRRWLNKRRSSTRCEHS